MARYCQATTAGCTMNAEDHCKKSRSDTDKQIPDTDICDFCEF